VIIHEEVLELIQPCTGEIVQLPDVRVHVVHFCDRDEPVIANLFLSVELLTFNYADEARLDSAARKAGSSIRRSTSIGSPSGAMVWGRKPKS
jgi:hypothetical protein